MQGLWLLRPSSPRGSELQSGDTGPVVTGPVVYYRTSQRVRSGAEAVAAAEDISVFKQRIFCALTATTETNFGVRQEYRQWLDLFRHTLGNGSEADRAERSDRLTAVNSECAGHRPYWVLLTADVNAFIASQINRWLLLLEVLMSQVETGIEGLPPVPQERQIINGAMISMVMQTMRLAFGDSPPERLAGLWKKSFRTQIGGRGRRRPRTVIGLGYSGCIQEHETAWLPREGIDWTGPAFAPALLPRLALVQNEFLRTFPRAAVIRQRLGQEDRIAGLFRERLQADNSNLPFSLAEAGDLDVLELSAQLITMAYIREIFSALAARYWRKAPAEVSEIERAKFLKPLSACSRTSPCSASLPRTASH